MDKVQPGDVLVTDMTDPDREPIMNAPLPLLLTAVVACHAAIIARELGDWGGRRLWRCNRPY